MSDLCQNNIIEWKPPKEGERPDFYRIYRDANLTKLAIEVSASQKLIFIDDCRNSNKTCTYFIVSVGKYDNRSGAERVTIK